MGQKHKKDIRADNGFLYFGEKYRPFMPGESPIPLADLDLRKVYGAIKQHKKALEDDRTHDEEYDPVRRTVSRRGCTKDQTIAYVERRINHIAPNVKKIQEEKKLKEEASKVEASPEVLAEVATRAAEEAQRLAKEAEDFNFEEIFTGFERGIIDRDLKLDGYDLETMSLAKPPVDQTRHQ